MNRLETKCWVTQTQLGASRDVSKQTLVPCARVLEYRRSQEPGWIVLLPNPVSSNNSHANLLQLSGSDIHDSFNDVPLHLPAKKAGYCDIRLPCYADCTIYAQVFRLTDPRLKVCTETGMTSPMCASNLLCPMTLRRHATTLEWPVSPMRILVLPSYPTNIPLPISIALCPLCLIKLPSAPLRSIVLKHLRTLGSITVNLSSAII